MAVRLRQVAVGPMAEGVEDAVGGEGLVAAELLEADDIDLLLLAVVGQLLTAVVIMVSVGASATTMGWLPRWKTVVR